MLELDALCSTMQSLLEVTDDALDKGLYIEFLCLETQNMDMNEGLVYCHTVANAFVFLGSLFPILVKKA